MEPGTPSNMLSKHSIAISHQKGSTDLVLKAEALAINMHLVHVPPAKQGEFNTLLVYTENGLQIQLKHDNKTKKPATLHVDFLSESLNYRRRYGGGIKQALARAVGIKPGIRPTILDATAGLGKDSFLLASLGCRVTMFERSPILTALLHDGLERAAASHEIGNIITKNLTLIQGDSVTFMTCDTKNKKPDTIYLDPMYPHSRKSALNKLQMRIIRKFVGDDTDADKLFMAALGYAQKRVVVKRPKGAPLLTGDSPAHVIKMKNSRYDVYMI
ncbi:class I SAM-dependent methyltransferase [Desulfocapsa sp. AH-315-J15]|nr:class I SAM-dependent methyltransferase [Desulfocapsa sp. AH-315-J15]